MTSQPRTMARLAGALAVALLAACSSTTANTTTAAATTHDMTTINHGAITTIDSMPGMNHGPAASEPDPMAGMDHSGGAMAMDPVIGDGTNDSAGGYTLKPSASPTATGTQTFAFTVNGLDGKPITDAVIEQTKKLHLIVVRSDLTGYQHVHPELSADGTWSVQVNLPTSGRWRAIADLTPVQGTRVVLGTDINAAGVPTDAAVPAESPTASVDGYTVMRDGLLTITEAPLNFMITKDGQPAQGLTPYLGAGGHLVALKTDTLAYTHLHPNSDPGSTLSFQARVPTQGTYRLFLQFATGDNVHIAEFTTVVKG